VIDRLTLDVGYVHILLFFFSSRRRHTRLVSDWSSDVCSSDLGVGTIAVQLARRAGATVLGIAGPSNAEWLKAHGVIPVNYGDDRSEERRVGKEGRSRGWGEQCRKEEERG